MNIPKNEQYFKYLFELQMSGRTNMLGAAPYLENKFGLDKNKSKEILAYWMCNYENIAKELNIEI